MLIRASNPSSGLSYVSTSVTDSSALVAWARSGAMALCGRADGPPLAPPPAVIERLRTYGDEIARYSEQLGRRVELQALQLLGERAALTGYRRNGSISCGGATRLLRAADAWLAVALVRDTDFALLPAWLGGAPPPAEVWPAVAERVAATCADDLVERAALLGLGVSRYAEVARPPTTTGYQPATRSIAVQSQGVGMDELLVVDLSVLWAGPLCSHILQQTGAQVIKVESVQRPDGARAGPAAFFDLLNGAKRGVALDFASPDDRAALRRLLLRADVVIEGSRPRALEQLGIDARSMLEEGCPKVWVSITGYGRSGPERNRVGFGDDAAAAGGLLLWDAETPCFCVDAIADPATGMVAALETLRALARGGRHLLDIPLAQVAARLVDDGCPLAGTPVDEHVSPPVARPVTHRAPALGEHTRDVLRRYA